jgi:hypothetical protein
VAFRSIPLPGSQFGPCAVPCVHRDCAESRRIAEAICPGCKKQIGYQKNFTTAGGGAALWHFECYLAAADSDPEKREG